MLAEICRRRGCTWQSVNQVGERHPTGLMKGIFALMLFLESEPEHFADFC